MSKITQYIIFVTLILGFQIHAQETNNSDRIEELQEQREDIKEEERSYLKTEVETINEQLENDEITQDEANKLKQVAAEKRALNIENRTAIIDNQIALLERNEYGYYEDFEEFTIAGVTIRDEGAFASVRIKDKNKPVKYDKRTTSAFVLAFGLNNAIAEGESLEDSPYKIWCSRFWEVGWAWKTRIFKESNAVRLKYGISFQFNGLRPSDNRYFVDEGNLTTLEVFPYELDKAKLNVTNLVFPVHFEFGPSKKTEKATHFRYSTRRQFKFGIGGYYGFKTGVYQKLKYRADGDKVKEKLKFDYNTSNIVYGLSSYIAWGWAAIYGKYDLQPLFKNQPFDQHNVSLGIRFDMD